MRSKILIGCQLVSMTVAGCTMVQHRQQLSEAADLRLTDSQSTVFRPYFARATEFYERGEFRASENVLRAGMRAVSRVDALPTSEK